MVAFQGAFADHEVVDRATAAFDAIIAAERAAGGGGNDHFAKAGANDRIWNALEKLAVRDPGTFVDYYGNDILALISTAWLGPAYQMTSQVNVVRPGGQAQDPHRDYHLGFLSNEIAARYPAHVHLLSPVLTLQGAVAHSDMPVESGPTMYLPYSHAVRARLPGLAAAGVPRVLRRALRPAAAGQGRRRLLQPGPVPRRRHQRVGRRAADGQPAAGVLGVRSGDGDGRPGQGAQAVYPVLRARRDAGVDADSAATTPSPARPRAIPFPSNLDLDANVGGLTPLAQAEVVQHALDEGWSDERLDQELSAYDVRHRTDEIGQGEI